MSTTSIRIPAPGGGHQLAARRTAPPRPPVGRAVIAPPHPQYGGEMSNPVVGVVESTLQRKGWVTVAFDYRGVGLSTGQQHGARDDGVADLISVGRHPDTAPLACLCGYSFGASCALHAATDLGVTRLLLIAPAITFLEPQRLGSFPGRLDIVTGEHDEYAPPPALRAAIEGAPNAQVQVLPGGDHFFMGSQLEALRRALATEP